MLEGMVMGITQTDFIEIGRRHGVSETVASMIYETYAQVHDSAPQFVASKSDIERIMSAYASGGVEGMEALNQAMGGNSVPLIQGPPTHTEREKRKGFLSRFKK
jgi:hypothetical protein